MPGAVIDGGMYFFGRKFSNHLYPPYANPSPIAKKNPPLIAAIAAASRNAGVIQFWVIENTFCATGSANLAITNSPMMIKPVAMQPAAILFHLAFFFAGCRSGSGVEGAAIFGALSSFGVAIKSRNRAIPFKCWMPTITMQRGWIFFPKMLNALYKYGNDQTLVCSFDLLVILMTLDKQLKTPMVGAIIALLCAVAVAPALELIFSKIPVYSMNDQMMREDSALGMQKAFARGFSLATDQAVSIKFSASYPNNDIYLKIVGRAQYEAANSSNSTPSSASGKSFLYYTVTYGSTPSVSYASSVEIYNDGMYNIEFKGSNLASIPGDYVVIVYGTNYTNSLPAGQEELRFNIDIKVDGPGHWIARIVSYAGWIFVVVFAAMFVYNAMKRTLKEGRS